MQTQASWLPSNLSLEVDGVWATGTSGRKMGQSGPANNDNLMIGGGNAGFTFHYGDEYVYNNYDNDYRRHTLYIDRAKYGIDGVYTNWSPSTWFTGTKTMELFRAGTYTPDISFNATIYRYTLRRHRHRHHCVQRGAIERWNVPGIRSRIPR